MRKSFFIIALFLGGLLGSALPARAANVTATLDDAAARPAASNTERRASKGGGSSVFAVNDSAALEQSHIDSDGNGVLKGCLRVDASGAECTVTEGLIVDGNVGIGTTGNHRYLVLPKNKTGHRDESQRPVWKNRLKNLFNVSVDDVCRSFYYKSASKSLDQRQKEPGVSSLPLFTSLFEKSDTVNHKPDSKYTKSYSKRQGHIFKEVAGNPDRNNIFTQIAVDFCHKFINSFFFGDHAGFLLGHNIFPFVEAEYNMTFNRMSSYDSRLSFQEVKGQRPFQKVKGQR